MTDRAPAGRAGQRVPPGGPHSPSRLEAVVAGRVQGVGFRYFVVDRARGLGLSGWVANLRDGGVRCVAEGPRARLEQLVRELERGPVGARVVGVQASWRPATGEFDGFTVHAGGHPGD
jgi:acylphosphatase